MVFDAFPEYRPRDFIFKIARSRDELQGYWNLRRKVFCDEQHVFHDGHDRDPIDDHAIPIICATLMAGMVDEVVGAVRIDQREPKLWYGGRLCVDRKLSQN